jgi:ribonuclease P protein component
MVVVVCTNEIEALRIGVVAGRVVGKAVQRNRAKRLLREAIRPYLMLLPPGWDILLIARQPLAETGLGRVQETLRTLLGRARLLQLDASQLENSRPAGGAGGNYELYQA